MTADSSVAKGGHRPRRRWTDLSLRGKGLVVMALPLTALLLSSLSFWVTQQKNERASDSVAETLALKTQLQSVLSLVVDAQTGVRGWLITGQDRFLEPYLSARRELPKTMRRLQELVRDDPAQRRQVHRLVPLVDERLAHTEELRRFAQSEGGTSPQFLNLIERGKAETDVIRDRVADLAEHEDALLVQHRRKADRARDQATIALLVAIGVGLGGGLAGALLFTRGVAERVGRLEQGARRLAEGDEIDDLPAGGDEVGRLGESLRRAGELLREREKAQQQAREAAEAANRFKSEFLSRMSHELRTPLNAVLGFSQLLQLDSLDEDQRDSAAQIVKAGHHLLNLIDEVLDISRIETGQLTLSLEPVGVEDVATESLDLVRPLGGHRRLRFPDEPAGDCSSFVRADRQRLKQVLVNLLSNAVKYNRNGGEVLLDCANHPDGRVRISVTDSGPGIPPEKLDLLFNPFERLGAEQSDVEGTGLGLALARRLMDAMGGTLGVDSEEGRGSTFWLELEATEAPAKAFEPVAPVASVASPMEPGSRRSKTLLYIEDNVANIKLVERILKSRPEIRLLVAMEGELGLALAAGHRPDLILLDLNLPDISGVTVLHRLRAEPASRNIPVVVVSADAMPRQVMELQALGAAHYLTKPFLVSEFLDVVDSTGGGTSTAEPQPQPEPVAEASGNGAASATAEGVLDPAIIGSLRELGDDIGSLEDLRSTFSDTARSTLDELQEAIGERDGRALRALAHRLKGSSGSMGAHRMARLCGELEQSSGEELDHRAVATTLDQLRAELEAVEVALAEALP
ncbi:MAG TPA: ATP-binding protein [Acidimicrobiales bacterium]|nr:ATP-binding protein [Acidimicrobiales bacterium]